MKIESKIKDTGKYEKRNDKVEYIVIQGFRDKTTHYQVSKGKVYQMIPDTLLSESVNGAKLNKYGIFHGICTKYNSISISLDDMPKKDDIELCKHLIITLMKRYDIDRIIRQLDITGESSPTTWTDDTKWNGMLSSIKEILE